MWDLKNKINEQGLVDTENKLMVARGEERWGTRWKGAEIEKYKLVVTK